MRIAKRGSHQTSLRMMRRCPLFMSLRPADQRNLLAKGQERQIMKREAVFRQGDRSDGVYLLTRGRIKLLLRGRGGRGIILAFIGPGEAFGYQAHLAGTPHTYDARAIVESSILAWDAADLEGLLGRHPATTKNALRLTARQVQDAWNRLYALVTQPVARRLAGMILRLARPRRKEKAPIVSVMQQDLAGLLGTTPPTLSRILGKWEARGLVSTSRERIVVLHPEGLAHLAESDDTIASWKWDNLVTGTKRL